MRRVMTIDIETLPAPESWQAELTAPSPAITAEEYRKTALNGDFGRILCIGYVDEDRSGNLRKGVIGWEEKSGQFSGDERAILLEFWDRFRDFLPNRDRIVGHNIFDFDLKFIYKRSVIHGVRPPVDLSFARYRNQPIFDTMYEWERWSFGTKISLGRLAKVLGLASSKEDGIDGSRIFDMFNVGRHRMIRDYCLRDVVLTQAIYRRMVFADCLTRSKMADEDKYAIA